MVHCIPLPRKSLTKIIFYLNAWSLLNFFLIDNTSIFIYVFKTYIYFFENDKTKARVQHNVTPPFFLPGPFIRYMYSQRPLDWPGGGGTGIPIFVVPRLEFPLHGHPHWKSGPLLDRPHRRKKIALIHNSPLCTKLVKSSF